MTTREALEEGVGSLGEAQEDLDLVSDVGSVSILLERMHKKLGDRVG